MITKEDFYPNLFNEYIIFKHNDTYCIIDKEERTRCFQLFYKNGGLTDKNKISEAEEISIQYLVKDEKNKYTTGFNERYIVKIRDLEIQGVTVIVG
jgi:hypothetical protein